MHNLSLVVLMTHAFIYNHRRNTINNTTSKIEKYGKGNINFKWNIDVKMFKISQRKVSMKMNTNNILGLALILHNHILF